MPRRIPWPLVAVLAVLAAVNVLQKYGPAGSRILALIIVAALLLISRIAGLSWSALGLTRTTWRRGLGYGIAAGVLIVSIYAIGALLPATRIAYADSRGQMSLSSAFLTALVIIPLRTVLIEEIAFRGILLAAAARRFGLISGYAISSVAFGLWHVLPSLGLARANEAAATVAGSDGVGRVHIVIGAVIVTTIGGVVLAELRRRSGSLLAPIIAHWASNGTAVIIAAWLHTTPAGS